MRRRAAKQFLLQNSSPGPEEGIFTKPGAACAFCLDDPQATMRGALCISNWPHDGVLVINEAPSNSCPVAEVYTSVLAIFFEKSKQG
jgi:hypothetical protein